MENNELTEEATKTKSTPQFNARISEELKQTIDEIGNQTGKSKSDLLEDLVLSYQTKRADEQFADMDLSRYDNLSNPLKESVHSAFTHILSAVNGNLSTLKQAAVHLEGDKKILAEKEKAYRAEIELIKGSSAEAVLALRNEKEEIKVELGSQVELYKNKVIELELKNTELLKELSNVDKIAEQVQVVTAENKELRESNREADASLRESNRAAEASLKAIESTLNENIQTLSRELVEAKQSIFRAELENDSKNKAIVALEGQLSLEKSERSVERKVLKEEVSKIFNELSNIKTEYNRALGKLEILERDEKPAK